MPRPPRIIVSDWCYHFINRANQQAQIFHHAADYRIFLDLLREAQDRVAISILAVCLMPNHVHLVIRPNSAADLARWAHWLFTAHARRHHARYATNGHVWQGRYKTCAIQRDHHLLTVMRYVERNALEAKLVQRAEDWRWGSLRWRGETESPVVLTDCPITLPS